MIRSRPSLTHSTGCGTRGPHHRAAAHGHPFEDCQGRCGFIKEHHHDRLQLLRDAAGGTGDAPVTEWMKVLFRERSWGDMAASETFAHLEHLRLAGEAVTHRDDDGLLYFELTDAG